jgi:integrase
MRVLLTDRFVAGVRPSAQRADYFDEKVVGLALRVSATGHKAWSVHLTSPRDGRRIRHSLGNYPVVTLAAARGLAIAARQQVEDGEDPRGVTGASDLTFGQLVDRYFADPAKASLRSIREIHRRVGKDVLPIIGTIKVNKLTRRDVRDVVERIAKRGAERQAFLTFKDVQAVLRWAVRHDYLDRDPIQGMGKPAGSKPRERILSDDEIHSLWTKLPLVLAGTPSVQRAIKLALVTGQRIGEIVGMRRGELDLDRGLWSLPGSRTKNRSPHHVPLSGLAVETIHEALAATDSEFLFPAQDGGPIDAHVVGRAISRARGRFGPAPWSAHDLRRTCLDNMARLGVAPHVIGHVANHRSITRSGVTFAHYVHHSYESEKRIALDLWADRLVAIVGGGGGAIVPMRRASL